MNSFTVTKHIKYRLDFANHYVWTTDNECYNMQTGKKIKQTLNNSTIGYNIQGRFYSLSKLRKHLVRPVKEYLPF